MRSRAADLDDQLVRFDAWVRGDGASNIRGDDGPAADLGARLALAVQEAHPYALAEVYGSRACGVELFDSDVDLKLFAEFCSISIEAAGDNDVENDAE